MSEGRTSSSFLQYGSIRNRGQVFHFALLRHFRALAVIKKELIEWFWII